MSMRDRRYKPGETWTVRTARKSATETVWLVEDNTEQLSIRMFDTLDKALKWIKEMAPK